MNGTDSQLRLYILASDLFKCGCLPYTYSRVIFFWCRYKTIDGDKTTAHKKQKLIVIRSFIHFNAIADHKCGWSGWPSDILKYLQALKKN